jgi:acetyl esterase/lipase
LPGGGYNREGIFPNPVFDFKAAVRFLRANAAKFKLDPARFAAAGGSAGGYHAVMAAASADNAVLYDTSLGYADVSGEVAAVVDWFGRGDLILQSEFTAKAPGMKLPDGSEFKMDNFAIFSWECPPRKIRISRISPLPRPGLRRRCPPTFIQCGAADEIVPVECSRSIAARIEAVCGRDRVTYEEFEGYAHGDMRFNEEANIRHMIEWLQKTLG